MNRARGLLVGIVCVLGCAQKPEPQQVPGPESQDVRPKSDIPVGRMTVEQYLADVAKDEVAAQTKYAKKTLELSGLYSGRLGTHIFLTDTADENPGSSSVIDWEFGLIDGKLDPRLLALSRGQSVTIRGTAHWINVRAMDKPELVAVGPSTALPTTVAEIDATLNRKDSSNPYEGKDLFLRITVADQYGYPRGVPPPGSRWRYHLAPPLGDGVSQAALDQARTKPGSQIMVLARLHPSSVDDIVDLYVRPIDTVPQGLSLPKEK